MTNHGRRTFLKTVGSTGALLALGAGSAVAGGPPSGEPGRQRQGASAENTIYDIAAGNDDFSTLVAALDETGLDDVLDGEGRQYTVFAPTNDAFEDLLAELGISAGELLADARLTNVLLYHVTNGRRYSSSVVNAPKIRMSNGEDVMAADIAIAATDIEASNGVVHVIDEVLVPPSF